jgi:hypothetical protein
MNKHLSYLLRHELRHRVKREKSDTTQLAAELAPLEEQKGNEARGPGHHDEGGSHGGATQEYGAIVVGNENLRLSKDIMEGRVTSGFLGMEPVVLVILVFMLAFIAFIAWQIWRMPPELIEGLLSP